MSFTPSPQQADAIRAIVDWFQNRTHQQQVFRLFGYAGTGKSHGHHLRHRGARHRRAPAVTRRMRHAGACSSPPSPARPRW